MVEAKEHPSMLDIEKSITAKMLAAGTYEAIKSADAPVKLYVRAIYAAMEYERLSQNA